MRVQFNDYEANVSSSPSKSIMIAPKVLIVNIKVQSVNGKVNLIPAFTRQINSGQYN